MERNESTKSVFKSFTPPWLFLNTAGEYSDIFKDAGFKVEESWIDEVVTSHSPEEIYKIFESGAAVGYLNQEHYGKPISKNYISDFRGVIRKSFESQADDAEKVKLIFYRVYLLAKK